MVAKVEHQEKEVAEFYRAEFIHLLKVAAWEQRQADVLALELIVEEAKDEGKAAGAKLTERLTAAMASGDRLAQHAVWREREVCLAQIQASVDGATAQMRVVKMRRIACEDLASALGV